MRAYLRGEVDAACIYRALAHSEGDRNVSEVFRRLATVEARHAEFWRARLERAGAPLKVRPGLRARFLAWVARRFGAAAVLPYLARIEVAESHGYDGEPDAVAAGMPKDEYGHARIVQAAAMEAGGLPGGTLSMIEGRRRHGGGNALRAAVLGANDGLVSNLSLVLGIVGAAAGERTIVLTGLAGLIAGACSMAMGEWLSVSSAREMALRQIETVATAIEQVPDIERQDLMVICRWKGLDDAASQRFVNKLFTVPEDALESVAREELGIDPSEPGGSPWVAAAASFGLFAFGALFPVVPFLFLGGPAAFATSVVLSGLALLGIGAATSLFTGRPVALSALRQLGIGAAAAALTYGLGHVVGASLG
ncbi:rubrerythrin family protein [Pseudomonas sp. C2L12B]|uniref:Rubrerythrin family protein n=2 Tax=Pseudomonas typographi TaxID=2715964 RepID=A0ABR7Z047_9PSED|nr:rubrerythrin family protein [Pseudomonas typographi]MBD1586485.1 rubrerythrin family protein [Pseudomonas typographi]MBD1598803.1 rubrerythrin family protein [Pseudomonas typographi]